ncbi:Oligopeptide transport ATP-binding protein OppF [Lachnospiraceae bacterium TWA4]|nr:Oligopeptide transport ATP-binding protein OppF [Lachnospiraceae bacterium TWA4]
MSTILEVKNLKQHFPMGKNRIIKAVDGISFHVKKGEIFGLVGESGCGKSTAARSIMGLYKLTDGEVYFNGIKISDKSEYKKHKKDIQKNLSIVFQDSSTAFNPRKKVKDLVAEPMKACKMYSDDRVDELLEMVGLDKFYKNKYPSELSGGQRQRVAIARSISTNPDLIIADEPIASLDISIQAQIVTLFQKLKEEHRFSFIFIAHDLSIVRFISDKVGVMLKGKLVEMAETEELFEHPLHDYTKALLSAIPVPDPIYEKSKTILDYDISTFNIEGQLVEVEKEHFVYQYFIV